MCDSEQKQTAVEGPGEAEPGPHKGAPGFARSKEEEEKYEWPPGGKKRKRESKPTVVDIEPSTPKGKGR